MITANELEKKIIKMKRTAFIPYLMRKNYIKKEARCKKCTTMMKLCAYKRNIDKCVWRCTNKCCEDYLKYF
ncbi:hypothetical protein H311_00197 [Anncaliia algerae PRA109]|nr:hypothetical protein H311_00197 [Anncaliia algerae PRA109]